MTDTSPASTSQNRRKLRPLLKLLPYLRPYRSKVILALFALLLASAATLIIPIASRRVVDNGFIAQNAELGNQ